MLAYEQVSDNNRLHWNRFFALAAGETISRGLQALAWIVIARRFGVEQFGELGFAAAVTSYGLLLVHQGIDPILVRECASEPHRMPERAAAVFPLRILVASGLILATFGWSFASGGGLNRFLLPCLSLSYAANALSPRWCFLAGENSRPLAISGVLAQTILLLGAILAPVRYGPVPVAAAQVGGEIIAACYLWRLARRRYGIGGGAIRTRDWAPLIRQSWPLLAGAGLGSALYNFDVIALRAFGRIADAGLYLSAYRFITVFEPILAAYQWSILPGLSRATQSGGALPGPLHTIVLAPLLAASVAAAFLFWKAEDVLRLVLGSAYTGAAPLLRILACALPLRAMRVVGRQALLASGRQKRDLASQALGVATNAGLDLALIPKLSATGCAISTVAAEAVYGLAVWLAVWPGRGRWR